jgi:hypothetical protein
VPLTLETHGQLGKPVINLLGDVWAQASEWGQALFTKGQFVQGALQELCVCLVQYNAMLERGVAWLFGKASGIAVKHGLSRPTVDVAHSD